MASVQTWGFESAVADGTGVFVRLTLLPERGTAWYWAYVFLPDTGLVVVRDHEVPLPRPGAPDLEVRADALWAELVCETPDEHWGIGLEAFGVVLDDPFDALRGELGTRVPVGLDLEWELLAPPYRDDTRASVHQFGRIHGELLVGTERIRFDAPGARDEHAGELGAVPGEQRATFTTGETLGATVAVEPERGVHGYVWRLGDAPAPLHDAFVEDHPGPPAAPLAARYVFDGTLEIEADVVSAAVIPFGDRYEYAALCRATTPSEAGGDHTGAGFARWIFPVDGSRPEVP